VTGIAAVLLVCFQFLSTVNIPDTMPGMPFQYVWTEYGVRATFIDEYPIAKLEEEMREDRIREEMRREREKREKAAS
ncbi:MAG: hypothetical protein ACXVP2_09405, partial [Tumebacillaceae bacterium]